MKLESIFSQMKVILENSVALGDHSWVIMVCVLGGEGGGGAEPTLCHLTNTSLTSSPPRPQLKHVDAAS